MKKLTSLLLIGMLATSLVACNATAPAGDSAPTDGGTTETTEDTSGGDDAAEEQTTGVENTTKGGEGDPLEVVLLSDGSNQEVFLEAAQPFTDETGIPIEVLCLNFSWGEYFTKLQTMIAGGDSPDLATVATEGVEMFHDMGLGMPLNPFLEANPEYEEQLLGPDNYDPAHVEALSVDGEYLAYPMGWNNCVIHLNTNLLEAAELEVPTADWTHEDFLGYLEKLTVKRDDGTTQYGTMVPNSYFAFEGWIYANGGEGFVNDDYTKATINAPESVEVFQLWQDIIHKYGYAPIPEPNVNYTQMMIDGDIGIGYAGRWYMGNYITNDFTAAALQYYPGAADKTAKTVFGIDGLFVMSGTDRYDDACKFSAFAGSKEYQDVYLSYGNIPGNLPLLYYWIAQYPGCLL